MTVQMTPTTNIEGILHTSLDPGLVWSAAAVIALAYAVRSARRSGLDPRSMYWAVVVATVGGFFGGHLMSLFVHGWQNGPMALLRFWQGSKSWYGGVIAGGLAGGLYFHFRRLPVLRYADASMPALALGYAIGRVGCFLNGDDFGTPTHLPWAVTFPPGTEAFAGQVSNGVISPQAFHTLPIHPVQIYASLVSLCLFVVLTRLRGVRPGTRLYVFMMFYGLSRFLFEFLRGDFRELAGPFSLPQVLSVALLAGGLLLWIRGRRLGGEIPSQDRAITSTASV